VAESVAEHLKGDRYSFKLLYGEDSPEPEDVTALFLMQQEGKALNESEEMRLLEWHKSEIKKLEKKVRDLME